MWTVAHIMTTTVFTIRSSAKVQQAIALMQEKQVRSLIVERAVAGGAYSIITEQDIVCKVTANGIDPSSMMVGEIMQQNCAVTAPHISLPAIARAMRDHSIQQMPVVEDAAIIGIISMTDIVMKSNIISVDLPQDFAQRVETALRHKRLPWSETESSSQESEIARDILAELSTELPAHQT